VAALLIRASALLNGTAGNENTRFQRPSQTDSSQVLPYAAQHCALQSTWP
jgi:hypothetical protein